MVRLFLSIPVDCSCCLVDQRDDPLEGGTAVETNEGGIDDDMAGRQHSHINCTNR